MYTMDIPINQSDFSASDVQPSKRRRKKSMVWDHFTIETVNGDCIKAYCNQCKKSFAYVSGSKLAGTSHLKRHITLGICPVGRHNLKKDQLVPNTPASRTNVSANGTKPLRNPHRSTKGVASIYFDGAHCGRELARMIIQHEYPLSMVENSGFIDFARSLQPQFNITSVSALQEQIMDIYFGEKQKVMGLLGGISGRLSLSVDFWTSNQSLAYVLLTGHFVDCNWKLQRRILSFIAIPSPDSDTAFYNAITTCLTDWNLEDIFSITLDSSHANEKTRENIRDLLSIKNSIILNGQLLTKSCYARTLGGLAQDAIETMRETIEKVRHSVKYVKTSEAHELSFLKLKQQLQVPSTKNLMIDDLRNWSTTYHMLMSACELKEVFSCLYTSDPDYKSMLSMEEWGQVETLCTYLKMFYDAANILTSPSYPTTNLFFLEVWKIHHELLHAAASLDFFISSLTTPLQQKFTKYWEDCNLILTVAVVMDPRFKMKLAEFSFPRLYGDDAEIWIKIVDEGLHEIYLEYVVQSLPPPTFIESGNDPLVKTEELQDDVLLSSGDSFSDLDVYISDIMSGQHMKSELDQYLEEPILPRTQDFDVLGWWRENELKYPTLSRLASDVLSIPLSTLPPDSVFDTRERIMDACRSSLSPSVLQALICSKDWLPYDYLETPSGVPFEIPVATVKTEY